MATALNRSVIIKRKISWCLNSLLDGWMARYRYIDTRHARIETEADEVEMIRRWSSLVPVNPVIDCDIVSLCSWATSV